MIIVANIVLFSVLNKKANQEDLEETVVSVAMNPLEQSEQTYRLQFYARGSECGVYINDQLVYDTYGNSIGSMVGDHVDNINAFLQNGENRFALKLLSRGDYFEPGDDYQCKAWIKAGKGKSISEVVAYLNVDYAGVEHFTMGDSTTFTYDVPTNFVPQFEVVESEHREKEAIVSGTLTFYNLLVEDIK